MLLGVISSEMWDFLQKGEKVVEHVEAIVNYFEIEEAFRVILHNAFAVILVKRC